MAPIEWAVFDLNGTLLDPGPALGALDDAILAAMALTLSGGYRPFSELLEAALERRGEDVEPAVEPFPEAPAALDALAGAGVRLAVLTNSATESAEATLRDAGLHERFEVVLGTDAVRAFKPDQRVYRAGLEAIGCAPGAACMVAAHWWDLLGAHAAGMRTAWVARKERRLMGTAPEPDARGDDLADAGRSVAALAAG